MPLYVAKFFFHITRLCRLHVGFACVFLVCLRVYAVFVSHCMRLPLYVAKLPFILNFCVYCIRVVRLCFWFDCFACMIVSQGIVDAFAFACCTVVFQISRVCK